MKKSPKFSPKVRERAVHIAPGTAALHGGMRAFKEGMGQLAV